MPTFRNYYAILGVSRTASQSEIKQAFRQLARQYHPDVNQSPGAAEKFKEINEAYQILGDPASRTHYDHFGSGPKGVRRQSSPPQSPPRQPPPRQQTDRPPNQQGKSGYTYYSGSTTTEPPRRGSRMWKSQRPRSGWSFNLPLPVWWVVAVIFLWGWGRVITAGISSWVEAQADASALANVSTQASSASVPATPTPGYVVIGRIAWAPITDKRQDIMVGTIVSDADGRNLSLIDMRQITHTTPGSAANSPQWSRDGEKLYYKSGYQKLYVNNPLSDSVTFDLILNYEPYVSSFKLSPDDQFVVYAARSSESSTISELHLSSIDGTQTRALTGNLLENTAPDWSPDGRKVIFQRRSAGRPPELAIATADGSSELPIENGSVYGFSPAWSPDGSRLAYTMSSRTLSEPSCSPTTCPGDLYVMDADGSRQTLVVTEGLDGVKDPAWSPNGKWIAFFCSADDRWFLCIVNTDGTDLARLITDGFDAAGALNEDAVWGIDWQ